MQDHGGRPALHEVVQDVTSLAKAKGRDQTFEFELYVLRWQAELATSNGNEELEGLVIREAAELRRQIETMTAA